MSGEPMWRTPEAYVHGLGAPVAIVPGRVAAWLEDRLQLRQLRSRSRGTDSEVDSVLVALAVAAASWRTSVTGNAETPADPPGSGSGWLSTTEAAQRLGKTDRAIRTACETGRLPADRHAGRWWITATDVEHYAAATRRKAS